MRKVLFFLLLVVMANPVHTQDYPAILGLEKRTEVYNKNLEWKLDNVLPELMRREGMDMWVVISFEYDEDPVYRTLNTWPGDGARRLSILVFHDSREGFKKLSATWHGAGADGYMYEGIYKDRSKGADGQFEALAEYISKNDPERIGINYDNTIIDDFSHANGLSHFHYEKLMNALDEKYQKRLVSAKKVVMGWFETRTQLEISLFKTSCQIAHTLINEFYSTRVIVPDATSCNEVRWWICERIREMKLDYWFFPTIHVVRSSGNIEKYGKDEIIRRGDLIQCDVGISYMGLSTDMQHIAYVCRVGEEDAPQGLKNLYAKGLRFQEIVLEEMIGGKSGNEIMKESIERGRKEDLNPTIYCHPVNYYGHGSGMTIGRSDNQVFLPGTGEHLLYPMTTYALEFNVKGKVTEWENEMVTMGFEDNVVFDGEKTELMDGYPQQLYLIK